MITLPDYNDYTSILVRRYFYTKLPKALLSELEMSFLTASPLPQEQERRRQGAQRLKERLSHIPWYKQQAEKDGDEFWQTLYASRVLS